MTAAIMGAHTVGKASIENSGYDGFWSDEENQGIFNNDYYHSLLMKGWGPEKAVNGNEHKNQWKITDLEKDWRQDEMMLNTDICMVYKKNDNEMCYKDKARDGMDWTNET
jgi:hypothetical protein